MKPLRWAVVGPGRIAHRFAEAVVALPDARLAWVQGRVAARVQAWAQRWSAAASAPVRVAATLAELLAQPEVDAVYVATPHALHGEAVRACLQAGKPVLCEKPLVPNHAQGAALVALARERGVFLMEALWTRFLPVYAHVGSWLRAQAIGPLRRLESTFCFAAPYDPASRLFDPLLAGGALLDVGVYNLSVTRWVLAQAQGACPAATRIEVQGRLAPTGVDQHVDATLHFGDALESHFSCGLDSTAANGLRIVGASGVIELPRRFGQATHAVLQRAGEPAQAVDAPFAVNGFEGEIVEAMRCIRAGALESPSITHEDTLATLAWMDEIRGRLGVRYPFE